LPKFAYKDLLGDAAASISSSYPTAYHNRKPGFLIYSNSVYDSHS